MDPERQPVSPISRCPDNNTVFPLLTGSIADIDRMITFILNSLSMYSRCRSEYINCLYNLAEARWSRYRLSREKEDLDPRAQVVGLIPSLRLVANHEFFIGARACLGRRCGQI